MGLFDLIFGKRPEKPQVDGAFKTLTAYNPAFTQFAGSIYGQELVRAAVDALARHSAKLAPTFNGSGRPKLRTQLRYGPNPWQTWSQFLYRTRTILEIQNNAFIIPVEEGGFFSALPSRCELADVDGVPWLVYTFLGGTKAALPFDEVGVLTRFQYQDDFFGESNAALDGTMQLLHLQQEGIREGIKNGATFRFMARVSNFTDPKDIAKMRKRFNKENLRDESGGVLIFPYELESPQQIKQDPYTVDAGQMELIRQNIFSYFGVNADVLQNKAVGDAWSAFYEGAIEPFAIQLSDVMTQMTFTDRELATGNSIFFTANRLQYMTNADKLKVSAELTDRGVMNRDEAREIWNLPPIPDGSGQAYVIRGEYKAASEATDESEVDSNAGET